MKIVVNRRYGGFSLSEEAYTFLGLEWDGFGYTSVERTDTKLVECVEALGDSASGYLSYLVVAEIPDDATDWWIDEYDGVETPYYVKDGKRHKAIM